MALDAFEIIINEMKEEGRKEIIEERTYEIAKIMLEKDFTINVISEITGLTVNQVKNL